MFITRRGAGGYGGLDPRTTMGLPPVRHMIVDTNFVTFWVFLGLFGYEFVAYWTGNGVTDWLQASHVLLPLVATSIGLIPGCGVMILTTTLYLNHQIPLSAMISAAVSTDGDALFPAIALAPRAALLATLYTAIPASCWATAGSCSWSGNKAGASCPRQIQAAPHRVRPPGVTGGHGVSRRPALLSSDQSIARSRRTALPFWDPSAMNTIVDPATLTGQPVRPVDHPPQQAGRIGVLLMNLGTPEATDYWSMRRYLKEFLSDRRVIETPRLLWWPLLNGIILTTRPGRKGATTPRSGTTSERRPAQDHHPRPGREAQPAPDGLAGDKVSVDWAMRYGKPEVRGRIQALLDQGCDRILSCRSIRNTRPRPRPPPATTPSGRSWTCAGSRPCASRRPITTTRSTSTPS
jgi:hypothetical protein